MKDYSIRILLIGLVLLNLLDGDFQNPSTLDWVKFSLLALCLILSFYRKGAKNNG